MTRPIERYSRMKNDIEDALARLNDFADVIAEINTDPFVSKPSDIILEINHDVGAAHNALVSARDRLKPLGTMVGGEALERPSVATVVDDGVKE